MNVFNLFTPTASSEPRKSPDLVKSSHFSFVCGAMWPGDGSSAAKGKTNTLDVSHSPPVSFLVFCPRLCTTHHCWPCHCSAYIFPSISTGIFLSHKHYTALLPISPCSTHRLFYLHMHTYVLLHPCPCFLVSRYWFR